ncbi:MAG: DUF4864 domain-containing protein [Gammaproteobacteria bacterium]|nr:DUF4864 domain-containing protein [Gammaproteobacteria bacterium]
MFCPSCGAQIPNGAHFCPQCGANVGDATASPPPQAAQPAPASSAQPQPIPVAVAAPEKKKHPVRRFLMWALAFIVAVIGLAMWATGDLVQVADDHLAALRSGDVDGAYALTSKAFRSTTPLATYRQFLVAYPILTTHENFEHGERAFENGTGYVKGTLNGGPNGVASVEFQMVKEGDVWRIQGFELK